MRSIAVFAILATMLVTQSEFPLGTELNSSMSGQGYNVKVTCKVTKNDDTYTYFYSIKNEGKEKTLVIWEAVSKALYYGHNAETMWEINPNENVLIVLESKEPPVYINASLYSYIPEPRKNFEKDVKEKGVVPEVKIKVSKSSSPVYSKAGGGTSAALPSSFIKKEVQNFQPYRQ
jgi:hypothetical protein